MQITIGYYCPGYWLDNKGSTLTCNFNNPAPSLCHRLCASPPYSGAKGTHAGRCGYRNWDTWVKKEKDRREMDKKEKNDSKRARVHKKKIRDRLNWNEQCEVCRARKARQLSLLVESAFVLTAHFGYTNSEWLSLAASDNAMISFCLDLRYSRQLWIIFPPDTDPIFIYSVSFASNAKRQNIFTKPRRSVATSLQTLLGIHFLLVPLFLSSICTMLCGIHVTQFVFSSFSTESRETVQSRNTQRNCSSTVSLFAEMPLLFALFTFQQQYSYASI